MRSSLSSVWDLKGGQNSCLIVWKTVTVDTRRTDSKQDSSPIIHTFIGFQHVSKKTRVTANSPTTVAASYSYKLSLRRIIYELSEIVLAGDIIRHEGISVAHANWFMCSKLPAICFFRDLRGFSCPVGNIFRFTLQICECAIQLHFSESYPHPTVLNMSVLWLDQCFVS